MSTIVDVCINEQKVTTTLEQVASVSKTIAEKYSKRSKSISLESNLNDEINSQFLGYLSGSMPAFQEKTVLDVVSLFLKYNCEKLLQSAIEFIRDNVSIDKILNQYVALTNSNQPRQLYEQIILELILTPQTILFEDSFLNLPTRYIEDLFSIQSENAVSHSLLFAFILFQIHLKKQESEPLLRFLSYDKLTFPQLLDLKEQLLDAEMDSCAYLVIQMSKIRNSQRNQITFRSRFDSLFQNSLTFNVRYKKGQEFNGIFNMLTKSFKSNIVENGLVTISASSNDPRKILGNPTKKYIWMSGNESNPFYGISLDHEITFNKYKITGVDGYMPNTYAIQISDDGHNWKDIFNVRKESSIVQLANAMGEMAENVKPTKEKLIKNIGQKFSSKHIRLINYGKNDSGSSKISLTSFELFEDSEPILSKLIENNPESISVLSSSYCFASILNHLKTDFWASLNIQNSYIQLRLNNFAVAITGYSLQTYDLDKDLNHLREWSIQGSLDGEKWVEIDRREPCNDLNGPLLYKYYQCQVIRPCRYIKIVSEGENHNQNYILTISSFEIFGLLIPDIKY